MKKKEEEFLKKLAELVKDINWEGTALYDYQKGDIPGIIIGRKEFINKLVDQLSNFDEIIRSMESIDKQENAQTAEVKNEDDGNNEPTFH